MTPPILVRGELLAFGPARGPTVFGRFDSADFGAIDACTFSINLVRLDGFRFNHLFFSELPEPGLICNRIATRVPATPPYEVDPGTGAVFLDDFGVMCANRVHMARIDRRKEELRAGHYTVTPEGLYQFSAHDRDAVVVIDFLASHRRPGWGAPTWSGPPKPIEFALRFFMTGGSYDGVIERFRCTSRRIVAPMPFEHVTIPNVEIAVIQGSVTDAATVPAPGP